MSNNLKDLVKKTEHLKVLYVEDEKDVRDETTRFLKKFFPSLIVECDGEDAWQTFKKEDGKFDLVITDYKMPTMNGNELMKKIKLDFPDTITILMSGITMNIDEEIVSDYKLSKPVDIIEFVSFLEKLILKQN